MKIAFGYKMRAGKDTAADYLIKTYGGKKISFAAPLYELMGLIQTHLRLPQEKDRKLLQVLGTEWGRSYDPNIWINELIFRTAQMEGNIFVTDVRFTNEAQALKQAGFTLINIKASEENRLFRGAKNLDHISEVDLDDFTKWDFILNNDGTKQEFYDILDIVKEIISGNNF